MKAKWVKAAGLLAAGSLIFSVAYIDEKSGSKDGRAMRYLPEFLPHWADRLEIMQ